VPPALASFNLFDLGASTFPNTGSPNPTQTILALTYRAADALIDRHLKKPALLAQISSDTYFINNSLMRKGLGFKAGESERVLRDIPDYFLILERRNLYDTALISSRNFRRI
jgi:hypothetical protein